MKPYQLTLFCLLTINMLVKAQNTAIADIEGRLAISPPNDSTSLVIGRQAGLSADQFVPSSFNTILGYNAAPQQTGRYNTFLGSLAGWKSQNGLWNTVVGAGAGSRLEGSWNTIVGTFAGTAPSFGNGNTSTGYSTGLQMTNGSYNSFYGFRAGNENRTANHGVAIGAFALYTNRENDFNVAIGDSSLYRVEDDGEIFNQSFKNTAVGASSLFNKNGFPIMQAVGVGYQAGYYGGDKTVSVGYRAGYHRGTGSVFLGFEAGKDLIGSKNNKLVISNRAGDDPLLFGEFDHQKIGINNSHPEMALHIGGTGNESGLLLNNAGDISFKNSSGGIKPILTLHHDDDTYLDAFEDLKFRINNNNGTQPDMILNADGDVGIGVPIPSYKLHVDGAVRGTDIICTSTSLCSDARFKTDFIPLQNALDGVKRLQGYSHHWRVQEFPQWHFPEQRQIGFKAEDVKELFPALVEELLDGYLTVQYSKMVPVLVEAIKEQQKIIDNKIRH